MENIKSISLIGAGGKMGTRIRHNLKEYNYNLFLCEKSDQGIQTIREEGFEVVDMEVSIPKSDIVILAVPDILIGAISKQIASLLKENTTVLTLDPAAAYKKLVYIQDNCSYVVAHPCHPSVFQEKFTKEEHGDLFGGVAAVQDIVIALDAGKEEHFEFAEEVAIRMYGPVENSHRVTVEQMAILEPTMAEVIACTTAVFLKEALEETVKKGVPRAAAEAFMLGHIQIGLAVAFKGSNPFSDACQIAIEYGMDKILKEDWKSVFDDESLDEVLDKMLTK